MNKTEARKILRDVRDGAPSRMMNAGSRFVFGDFTSAIKTLGGTGCIARDRRLVACGYSDLGDCWDFNDAPRAAVRAYRLAVRVDPGHVWAWKELGCMHNKLSQWSAALKALRRAEALGSDDIMLEDDIEQALTRDHWWGTWWPKSAHEASELLARNRPLDAVRLLQRKRHPYLRKVRARAYAARGDIENMLREWERLAATTGPLEVEQVDWFYIPDEVLEKEPRFWRALYALRARLGHGWSFAADWLWDQLPERPKTGDTDRWEKNVYLPAVRRMNTLWFRYEIARTEKSYAKAARLAERYPEWPEATELAQKLHRG